MYDKLPALLLKGSNVIQCLRDSHSYNILPDLIQFINCEVKSVANAPFKNLHCIMNTN